MKKITMGICGIVIAGLFALGISVEAKAALPCTYDIIDDANGDISVASANYEKAKLAEAQALATFNAVKNDPAHSQLEYEAASLAYSNAVNESKWRLDQLNNAKAYLKNITERAAFEDRFAANRAALADLNKLSAAKADADGAANIASAAAKQIEDVEKAIAGYSSQLATSPSVQPLIDALNAQLPILKADYAAKQQAAKEKAALFETYQKTLNYQSYSVGFEDYQYNREIQRDNLDWDPSQYNF